MVEKKLIFKKEKKGGLCLINDLHTLWIDVIPMQFSRVFKKKKLTHDITDILSKVALNTITLTSNPKCYSFNNSRKTIFKHYENYRPGKTGKKEHMHCSNILTNI